MLNLKYYQALNRAIHDEMVADESVVLLGEDVGESGGIFGQTKGLFDSFGSLRVRDTPIAENGFVSTAIGAAMTGLRPVVEIGFEDFLTACMDPLVNQAAKLRYMMGGQVNIPMVVYTIWRWRAERRSATQPKLRAVVRPSSGAKGGNAVDTAGYILHDACGDTGQQPSPRFA